MADEAGESAADGGAALLPLAPGPLLRIARAGTAVEIAPEAGGRIAQIVHDGLPWLVGPGDGHGAAIAWGCYPMLPWAGRLRDGRFRLDGREYGVAANFGEEAIHGIGFTMPWEVDAHGADHAELSLRLPRGETWPLGGIARQRIEVDDGHLLLTLSLAAEDAPMPAVAGWHPWFAKPDRIRFSPRAMYPRDREGIAKAPPGPPSSGPWDDCFLVDAPIDLERGGRRLRLTSDCRHWVIYDLVAHGSCVEPQTGPPDGPNIEPRVVTATEPLRAWFCWRWS
jgi:aldose 1-epimerase